MARIVTPKLSIVYPASCTHVRGKGLDVHLICHCLTLKRAILVAILLVVVMALLGDEGSWQGASIMKNVGFGNAGTGGFANALHMLQTMGHTSAPIRGDTALRAPTARR